MSGNWRETGKNSLERNIFDGSLLIVIKYITGIALILLVRPNFPLDFCRAILLTRIAKIFFLGGRVCYKSSKTMVLEAFRIWTELEKNSFRLSENDNIFNMSNSFSHEASKTFWHFQLVFRYYNKSQGNDFAKPLKEAHNLFLYAAAEQSGYSLLPPPVGQELIPSLKQSMQSTAQKNNKKRRMFHP